MLSSHFERHFCPNAILVRKNALVLLPTEILQQCTKCVVLGSWYSEYNCCVTSTAYNRGYIIAIVSRQFITAFHGCGAVVVRTSTTCCRTDFTAALVAVVQQQAAAVVPAVVHTKHIITGTAAHANTASKTFTTILVRVLLCCLVMYGKVSPIQNTQIVLYCYVYKRKDAMRTVRARGSRQQDNSSKLSPGASIALLAVPCTPTNSRTKKGLRHSFMHASSPPNKIKFFIKRYQVSTNSSARSIARSVVYDALLFENFQVSKRAPSLPPLPPSLHF